MQSLYRPRRRFNINSLNSQNEAAIYFAAFWTAFGGLLTAAMYRFRWKSGALWTLAWIGSAFLAALLAGSISGALDGLLIPLLTTIAIYSIACRFMPPLTAFGYGAAFLELYLPTSAVIRLGIFVYEAPWQASLQVACYICLILLFALMIMASLQFISPWLGDLILKHPKRDKALRAMATGRTGKSPKVSIHVPCYCEPPELVIATLDAISRLRYPDFEVIVIDNNTKDAALWTPVEEHCKRLGERFRFFHVDPLSGAKAGALNFIFPHTAADAEIIAVIDADYIAEPDFLEKYVIPFEDPGVGFVQTSHDYHQWENNRFLTGAYYEYQPYHKLMLPVLSEYDAGCTMGTMCLIRREALEKAGGWAEWCLSEDAELATRIRALGYSGHNFADTAGKGLIPETMESVKKQQFRWTAGPVQQLIRHWRLYLGLASYGRLTFMQKFLEIQRSLTRLPCALNVLIAPCILVYCLHAIYTGSVVKMNLSTLLLIAASLCAMLIESWICVRRIGGRSLGDYICKLMARNALEWTYARGFIYPFFQLNIAWVRTDKFKQSFSFMRALASSRTETLLAAAHFLAAAILFYFSPWHTLDNVALIAMWFFARGLMFSCTLAMALLCEYELYAKDISLGEIISGRLVNALLRRDEA